MNHKMSNQKYITYAEYYRNNYEPTTLEILAYSSYDELLKTDHENFISFIYECIKDRAKDYQHFAEVEEHEFLTIYDCIHILIKNNFFDRDTKFIKDFICKPQPDSFSDFYHVPLLYDYDPSESYTRA